MRPAFRVAAVALSRRKAITTALGVLILIALVAVAATVGWLALSGTAPMLTPTGWPVPIIVAVAFAWAAPEAIRNAMARIRA